MKLIIYIILFIILIIYINNQSIEQFTNQTEHRIDKQKYLPMTDYKQLIASPSVSINNTKHPSIPMHNPYITINQYNANYNPYFKSHLNNSKFDNIVAYNDINNINFGINNSYSLNPTKTTTNITENPIENPIENPVENPVENTVENTESIATTIATANAKNTDGIDNWVIKDTGYSDIFNDEDIGSYQINHILNTPKPVHFLDKTMTDINNKIAIKRPFGRIETININSPKLPGIGAYQMTNKPKQTMIYDASELSDIVYDNVDYYPIEQDKHISSNKNESYSDTIIDNNNKYHLLGIAYNHVYTQYYLIYESIIQQKDDNIILKDNMSNMKLQLYNYALVQMENNKEVIKYIFGPRDKINYNDIVYFHQGFIKLGPFIVNNI